VNEEFQLPERRGGFFASLSRGLRALILPVVFIAVGGYFIWHAVHGERGLIAREQRQQQIADARAELERARAEQHAMERRVQALRGDRLDRDQLDERARQLLNMVGRDEIVVPYGPTGRLF
jgi:cell division protein FtsB